MKVPIVKVPYLKGQYSDHLYNSNSFLIRMYAYLPFIYCIKHTDLKKNAIILDIGASDGSFLPTLNRYSDRVCAVDLSFNLIQASKNLIEQALDHSKKINILVSDGLYLPFQDNTYDIIYCLEVLEHVKNPKQAIKEIFRVLKKNGQFICTVPLEIGLSLLIRNFIGKISKFRRPRYSRKELIRNIILKKPAPRNGVMNHKNFDWRIIKKELKRVFDKTLTRSIPIPIITDLNPIILFKSVKN